MNIWDSLELILTALVFVLIWGAPRLFTELRKRKKRRKAPQPVDEVPVASRQATVRVSRPVDVEPMAEVFAAERMKSEEYSRPSARAVRRHMLQRAVAWKEILDRPKALRDDPFGDEYR